MERKRQSPAVKRNGNKEQSIPAQPTPERVVAAMERTVQRVRQMSRRELVQSLKGLLFKRYGTDAYHIAHLTARCLTP